MSILITNFKYIIVNVFIKSKFLFLYFNIDFIFFYDILMIIKKIGVGKMIITSC